MLNCFVSIQDIPASGKAIPILPLTRAQFSPWLAAQSAATQQWVKRCGFDAEPQSFCLVPDSEGGIAKVLVGVVMAEDIWGFGGLAYLLPNQIYQLDPTLVAETDTFDRLQKAAILGWGLGAYRFTRYKKPERAPGRLVVPNDPLITELLNQLTAIYMARDLINTPADDLGPEHLAAQAKQLASVYAADFKEIVGEALLKANFPAIYIVGRASDEPPRLIDLHWGNQDHPKLTLVGKGVCFDSGGLDLKNSASMLSMKKDMGGAAMVLALAGLIMEAKLPVRLRILIPAVENVISGNAYHPGDVILTRSGLSVEIGNTDAEGRLILADTLSEAVRESPDLVIDIATLTGAARVALGPDLPVLLSNRDDLAKQLLKIAKAEQDPLWQLPLYQPYFEYLKSSMADLNNSSEGSYAGAITAGLFLERFVNDLPWLHIDMMAWNPTDRPGRPRGGEAMGLRALFAFIKAVIPRN
jgi:leucyl aminopeptidase